MAARDEEESSRRQRESRSVLWRRLVEGIAVLGTETVVAANRNEVLRLDAKLDQHVKLHSNERKVFAVRSQTLWKPCKLVLVVI